MKVSVIMVDGSFRENTYGAEYFTKQDFTEGEYEVIWVEFYKRANELLYRNEQIKIVTLNNSKDTIYHSSFCFNEGIKQAKGELLLIPDADVIVESDFIQKAWNSHQECEELVAYGYRCNEVAENELSSLTFDELKEKCVITNPINYGGCLTVKKKWLLKINGYEQHEILESGFHANGLDIYTRFRNFGLSIKWDHTLRLYHPMHSFTGEKAPEYQIQNRLITWRSENLEFLPLKGIDPTLNTKSHFLVEQNNGVTTNNEKQSSSNHRQNIGIKILQKIKTQFFR